MEARDRLLQLTGREVQTFNLVVQGLTTREISEVLGVSVHTAGHHRRRVYEKLEVRNVAGAIRCAASAGWFGPHD